MVAPLPPSFKGASASAQPEGSDIPVLLQVGLDGGTERTGAFAVNNAQAGKPCQKRVIHGFINCRNGFVHSHAAHVNFGARANAFRYKELVRKALALFAEVFPGGVAFGFAAHGNAVFGFNGGF